MGIQEVLNYLHSPTSFGIMLEVIIILIIAIILKYTKTSSLVILIDFFYEKIYSFFEEILGEEQKRWIKTYIVTLFFIIFLSNFLGIVLEIIAPIFGIGKEGEFILEHFVSIPSRSINFNLALAIISVFTILYIQFNSLGIKHFAEEYFPIRGKGYLPIERGNKKAYIYYPSLILVKTFDIVISLFLGLLEIVGLIAKIISLSFRLFGNITSGTILLAMAIFGMNSLTQNLFSINFPVLLPVLIYLQEILVAFIQAIVFPLLVSIFIKVAISGMEENG
nr:F0F1 ATP synthase subunit A [Candidatus Gracilibacteria bacterium]